MGRRHGFHGLLTNKAKAKKIAKKKKQRPAFFQPLYLDFVNMMKIPSAFVEKDLKGIVPKKVVLKSRVEPRYSWPVQVQYIRKDYYLCDGWRAFAKDHGLEEADFLVFTMFGTSTFKVGFFDQSCRLKPIKVAANNRINGSRPVVTKSEHEETPNKKGASTSGSKKLPGRARNGNPDVEIVSESDSEDIPSFPIQILRDYQKQYLVVPKGLVEEAELKRKREMMIEDPKGRKWRVGMYLSQNYQVRFSAGWAKFMRKNQVVKGDTLHFHFISRTQSIRVQIV
ncbi:hypothetical protein COLO4_11318 [Corchorus olitorius]|uniref:TF-B3 domain-containing protein n=1 Tax=Corchorus olitorius TaxID=93759 RepID=A0A1R3K502_9ROSI|nr:hypothetical protein COLO4_11318 [Corchorus olitorius]